MTIAELTRTTRQARQLSGDKFARALGIYPISYTRAAISLWETGKSDPSRNKMQFIHDNTDPTDWRHEYSGMVLTLLPSPSSPS